MMRNFVAEPGWVAEVERIAARLRAWLQLRLWRGLEWPRRAGVEVETICSSGKLKSVPLLTAAFYLRMPK